MALSKTTQVLEAKIGLGDPGAFEQFVAIRHDPSLFFPPPFCPSRVRMIPQYWSHIASGTLLSVEPPWHGAYYAPFSPSSLASASTPPPRQPPRRLRQLVALRDSLGSRKSRTLGTLLLEAELPARHRGDLGGQIVVADMVKPQLI